MNNKKRLIILQRLRQQNSKQTIQLNFSSPFELLISVMLSARTLDINVNRVTKKLYFIANTPQLMIRIGLKTLKSYIKTVGLFNKKAENIIKICHVLLEKYNGLVPEDRIALESLPGIGRKTANIVLNVAFGWPTIAVDTHVFRVCNRTRFAIGKNVEQVEKTLLKVVPKEFQIHCHYYFITHGRYICKSRNPSCISCTISDLCEFKNKISF